VNDVPSKLNLMNKLGVIFLTYRRQLQKELVPYQITLKQQFILKQLAKKEFLYPSEIAEMLYCDRPTASVVIKNMEKQHWIIKEKDSENGKQIKITLTDNGRKKLADLKEALQTSPYSSYNPIECFSEDEKKQFEQLLDKLWKHIKAN
jgi:DNA-binding MarR family transcriptional regulator